MRIAVIIYTYPDDFKIADRAIRVLKKNWDRTKLNKPFIHLCIHKSHLKSLVEYFNSTNFYNSKLNAPPKIITHSFDAGGHLQYSNAAYGMRNILSQLYKNLIQFNAIIKMDSDCMLLRPECFTNPLVDSESDFVYTCQKESYKSGTSKEYPIDITEPPMKHMAWGPCYLLSRRAVKSILDKNDSFFNKAIVRGYGHEDRVWTYCLLHSSKIRLSEISNKLVIGDPFDGRVVNDRTVFLCNNPRKQPRLLFDVNGNYIPSDDPNETVNVKI